MNYKDEEVSLEVMLSKIPNTKGFLYGKMIVKNQTNKTIMLDTNKVFIKESENIFYMYRDSIASMYPILEITPFEEREESIYFASRKKLANFKELSRQAKLFLSRIYY